MEEVALAEEVATVGLLLVGEGEVEAHQAHLGGNHMVVISLNHLMVTNLRVVVPSKASLKSIGKRLLHLEPELISVIRLIRCLKRFENFFTICCNYILLINQIMLLKLKPNTN